MPVSSVRTAPGALATLAALVAAGLAACLRGPPKVCEADSDCDRGQVCLTEATLVSAEEFARQKGREPRTVCQNVRPVPRMPLARDGTLYVGAAKVDISPRGFETHNNVDDPVNCPKNRPWIFEGYIDAPLGGRDPKVNEPSSVCLETFNDTNGNGVFDAVYMGGFNNAQPAQGVDPEVPIMARLYVVSLNGEYFALVSMDFVGILPNQQDDLRKILHVELGLRYDRVLVHVTHNHEGPDVQGLWGPTVVNSANDVARAIVSIAGDDLGTFSEIPIRPGVNPSYWPFVQAKVLEGFRQAMARMRPARIRYAAAPAPTRSRPIIVGGQTINVDDIRFDHADVRLPDFNGDGILNDPSDIATFISGSAGRVMLTDLKLPHITDPLVTAFQAVDAETGETLVTHVTWSNHVEAQSDENPILSADYPGFLCNYIERRLGGTAVFTAGEVGGLQTQLRDMWVPMMDADGNFLDDRGRVVATMEEAAKAPNGSREKAAGQGRLVGRVAVEALLGAPFTSVDRLRVGVRYAWIPLDNPFFYIGGRLGILPGLSDWLTGKRRSDLFRRNLPECGTVGCLRTDIMLVDLGGFKIITSPGELYPEYVVGRAASTFRYGGDRMARFFDVDRDGLPDEIDPEIATTGKLIGATDDVFDDIPVRYRFPFNPQRFAAIAGLRPEDARRSGTSVLMVMSETNGAYGYLIPESDFINAFEGFLNGVEDYTRVLGQADLRAMLDLRIPDEILLRPFIDELRRLFPDTMADLDGVALDSHENQQGDTNSTGRRSGNIVYNAMCELLAGGVCPTRLPVDPDPSSVLPAAP